MILVLFNLFFLMYQMPMRVSSAVIADLVRTCACARARARVRARVRVFALKICQGCRAHRLCHRPMFMAISSSRERGNVGRCLALFLTKLSSNNAWVGTAYI